jgi:hypothetical protein
MVSYKRTDLLQLYHSTRFSWTCFMGDFKQVVFGASNPYDGSFFVAPPVTVPSEAGAPCIVAEGISLVPIGDLGHFEFQFPAVKGAR